jgi:anti-sigma regulatory factor (Ser/Thr protein kinase)
VDPAAADDTALIVTEIVTNAVRHGLSGDVHLRIDLCGDALTVRVEDQTPYKELPPAGVAGSEEESGRGLLLVEALAERWGHGPVEDGPGTAVWALIRLVAE